MSAPAVERIPPEIIVIPPMRAPTRTVAVFFAWLSGGFFIGAGVLYFVIPDRKAATIVAGVLASIAATYGILAGVFFPMARKQERTRRLAQEKFAKDHETNPAAVMIASFVAARKFRRFRQRIVELNRALPAADPPRARVACVGQIEPPTAGPHLFEPEIITPTRYMGRNLIIALIGLGVLVLMIVRVLGLVSWLNAIPIGAIGGFGYFYIMALIFGSVWIWRTTIRPTYLRVAPGVIEVLRYRFRGGKPDVRSFPMDAGTLAMVYLNPNPRRPHPLSMILARGDNCEAIQLWQIAGRKETLELFWRAMFSTAPIRPMSDQDLVG